MAAAKKKAHTVGGEFETTIIFTKKTVLEDLAEAKRNAKKRTQSINGTIGQKIAKAVEDEHLDRKAFGIALQLDAMDDERLHMVFHNMLDYCEKLGVTKRATAQEELFDAEESGERAEPQGSFSDAKPSKSAKEEKPSASAKKRGSGATGTDIANADARAVSETAGGKLN